MPETRYGNLFPRVWCRSPRIDFYRDRTARSVANRRSPRCCAANYLLLARNRPAVNLFIQCVPARRAFDRNTVSFQKTRPACLHGSRLISRCSSASTLVNLFNPGTGSRHLGGFKPGGFCYHFIHLVRCSVSQ